jgi:hypothetical protein
MTPAAYIAAHGTTRWHTNHLVPPQSVADHAAGVARFILWLYPRASVELLREALHHDDGEGVVGDIPGPAKSVYWHFAKEAADAEALARIEMGTHFGDLPEWDARILRLCDKLEAYTWAATMAPPHVVQRADWQEMNGKLRSAAWGLSQEIGAKVEGWLKEVHGGR